MKKLNVLRNLGGYMKKFIKQFSILVFMVLFLYGCGNAQIPTPSPSLSPSPTQNADIKVYGSDLVEGIYQGLDNASITIKDEQTSAIQNYSTDTNLLEDISALDIKEGDKVIVKYEIVDGDNLPKAIEIEKLY